MRVAAGKTLERIVRQAGRELEEADRAFLTKWPEDIGVAHSAQKCGNCQSWNQGVQIQYRARTGCDFFGYTRAGQVIMVECKECVDPSLPMSENGLKAHQYIALKNAYRAGGISLLLWLRRMEIATIPFETVVALSQGRKSIPWKNLPHHLIRSVDVEPIRLFDGFI